MQCFAAPNTVTVLCSVLQCCGCASLLFSTSMQSDAACCSVVQCSAVYCSVLQCVVDAPWLYSTVERSVLQCVAVCCSVLQCVAVCCSTLQCVTELLMHLGFIPQQPQHLSLYTRDRQLSRDATTLAHGLPHVYKHLSKTKEPAKSCGKKQPHLHTYFRKALLKIALHRRQIVESTLHYLALSIVATPPKHTKSSQISQYLAVQIEIEILVSFVFVPRDLSVWIW